jgi:adenine-specific DNA-methyltransferase
MPNKQLGHNTKELVQAKDNKILRLEKEIERLKKSLKKQHYGLVWMDVPEAFEDDVENKLPILKEVPALAIKSNDDKPTHILIEGDNYHALTCLNYTHKGKIDVIYIDPPYNTGSDGFKYKDKRILDKFPDGTEVPKDHPYRHSYWLSFMRKRLELAKGLLKRTGTFFVSINEDEFAQLKLLCDQIFGLENYLTMFTIKVRHEERILKGDKDFHEVVEYLLMYRSSPDYKTVKKIYDNTSVDEYVYQIIEKNDNPKVIKLGKKDVQVFEPGEYEVKKVAPSAGNLKKINIRGSLKEGNSSGRFYMAYIEDRRAKGVLYRVPEMGNDKFGYRYFITPEKTSRVNGDYFQGVPLDIKDTKEVPYPNFFDFEKEFNSVGYEGDVSFGGGKKPINFLNHFIKIGTTNKSAVILDFFAGSGSTAHAVMKLNEDDNGKRQFVLCTNNENNIMSDICYPRIKGVINGSKGEKGLGNSVKYYQTAFVGKNNILDATDRDKIELAHNAGELLAIAENTFELVKQTKCFQVFENHNQFTAVYFKEENDKFDDFVEEVKKLKKNVSVYVFSWENEESVDAFEGLNHVRIKTIPQPILEIYKQIYNLV